MDKKQLMIAFGAAPSAIARSMSRLFSEQKEQNSRFTNYAYLLSIIKVSSKYHQSNLI